MKFFNHVAEFPSHRSVSFFIVEYSVYVFVLLFAVLNLLCCRKIEYDNMKGENNNANERTAMQTNNLAWQAITQQAKHSVQYNYQNSSSLTCHELYRASLSKPELAKA